VLEHAVHNLHDGARLALGNPKTPSICAVSQEDKNENSSLRIPVFFPLAAQNDACRRAARREWREHLPSGRLL
jgi:hypothetical protein